MRRREFLGAIGAVATWPLAGHAQRKLPVIGILLVGEREPLTTQLVGELTRMGYVDRENIHFEYRSAGGQLSRLPGLAAELVAQKVDIIVASETPAVQAAKQATADIPIVMAPAGDPVGTGLVASLARPGGNVTGLSGAAAELAGKSLELIYEILPQTKRVGALAEPDNPFTKSFLAQIHLAARVKGTAIEEFLVRTAAEVDTAFAGMNSHQVDAVIVQPTMPRGPAVEGSLKYRMPSVAGNRAFTDAGGLMSYAASLTDRYRNGAVFIDRILKGAKPADLPVQQPTRFELIVNLKTAKLLGLTIPATFLGRADEVIE